MSTPNVERHWADEVASQFGRDSRAPVISTGISPSGEIHIGNMREVLTGDAIYRALKDQGVEVRFNYIADNYDPLRKVYPFLDEAVYAPLVGRPLSEIRCPCGDHESYSDHFLEPFLDALRTLHVEVEVERADQMYKSGRMNPYVIQSLQQRDRIAEILFEMTGKEVAGDWSPFTPICEDCQCVTRAKVVGFSAEDQTVDYRCGCGFEGSRAIAGGGKLLWRVDWPARWRLLGVSVEPFGKDHSTRGGSYDTGGRVIREVFGGEPPFPVPYEWIRLTGKGDMSSSKGNVLSISRMLEVVPPEVLRYFVIRERPQKTLNFDPGLPLLQLVDEVDDAHSEQRDERALELSRAGSFQPVGVPFKHLVVVAQIAQYDADRTLEILEREGAAGLSRQAIEGRLDHARRWLESFAPQKLKFQVRSELPPETAELSPDQRAFLGRLGQGLQQGMDGQAVHELIYELGQSLKPAERFRAIYLALLGQSHGPRAGWFVALLGAEFCGERFRLAGSGSGAGATGG